MIYDFQQIAALGEVRDLTFSGPAELVGQGLWAAVVSRGSCTTQGNLACQPGAILLGQGSLTLNADTPCHILAARLCGSAAVAFAAALPAEYYPVRGETCPAAAELLEELRLVAQQTDASARAKSQLVFALLCELSDADAEQAPLPPLVAEAVNHIRHNYAGLYGVEELSEYLGVSKSHLVRAFGAAMGVSPGKYLTGVRIEAAKRLLLHREYSLEIVASLCGFSGANYLCRVFKKETGLSPAAWRSMAASQTGVGLSAEQALREQQLYV
ncbi:MAG: helix-turn-helix transcriptional regulator [Faecalibacterium sp.]|nr:helix-turn-helix transcriptional regulator [Faecalibacterium sp.]